MSHSTKTTEEAARRRGPSRGEVETICLLYAIGAGGCSAEELAERLGLSRALTQAIVGCVDPFVVDGRVRRDGDRLALTDVGARWLAERWAAILSMA